MDLEGDRHEEPEAVSLCVVCVQEPRSVAVLPCKHYALCTRLNDRQAKDIL